MTTETAVLDSPERLQPTQDIVEQPGSPRDRHRFTVAVVIGFAVVSIPYLWILWDLWTGTADPSRQYSPSNFYDLQARAMFAGHLYLPHGSIGIEAFVHHGRDYTYFGLFPSILRMPVLALTSAFDGQLTAPSMLLAWSMTGLFTSLLLWRGRMLIRGQAAIGRAEAACCGVLVATITGGSVLMYLAASPKVSHEDLAWSVALTIGGLFALLGVLERPSRGRVIAAGLLILGAALDRGSTGYACIIGALLVAGWFALGRGGSGNRRWAVPVLVAGLVPLIVMFVLDWVKFGQLFGFSEADQIWTQVNAHRRYFLAANGGSAFGLQFLPSTLTAYMNPGGLHLSSAFPYITLPTAPAHVVGNVVLDQTYPTASISASMPLLFLLSCWGLVTAFRPKPVGRVRMVGVVLVAAAGATAGVLLFGYIADRYLADFLPFLALASMIGLVDVWRRLEGSGRNARGMVLISMVAFGVFSIWANVGAAVTPSALWTTSQSKSFVTTQKSISGGFVESLVERGRTLPYWAPAGTLFAADGCSGLYVSTGFTYKTVPGQQLQHETWDAVEQGPGSKHVLKIVFNRAIRATDRPVTLMTYGKTSLVVAPTGVNQVRLQVKDAGAPAVLWPPATSTTQVIRPHKTYAISVMTDPNLTSIVVGGLGGGIEHYLGGKGPAVVETTASAAGSPSALVSVRGASRSASQMTLCRSLVRNLAK